MVAIAASVTIPVPGSHGVALKPTVVFYQKLFIENMGLVKKETTLLSVQPRFRQNNLIK